MRDSKNSAQRSAQSGLSTSGISYDSDTSQLCLSLAMTTKPTEHSLRHIPRDVVTRILDRGDNLGPVG